MRLMRLAIPATAALLALGAPPASLGDAGLESTVPAAGEELTTPPDEVILVFDGELSPDGSTFTVTDAGGTTVGRGELDLGVPDRNELRGTVDIRRPGTYEVDWTAVAADGHREAGEFTFSLAEDVAPGSPDTALAPVEAGVLAQLGAVLVLAAAGIGLRRARRGVP